MEYPPSYFLRAPIRISKYLSHSTGPRPFTFSPTVVSVSAACWGKAEFDISSRDVTPEHWPITLTFVPGSPGNPGSPCGPMKPGSPFKNTIREECWITYKAVCNYNNTSLFWVVFPPVLLTDLWLWCNSYFSSWVTFITINSRSKPPRSTWDANEAEGVKHGVYEVKDC